MEMDLGSVSLRMPTTSLMRCLGWTATRSPSTPRANDKTCLTMSAPRSAFDCKSWSHWREPSSVAFIWSIWMKATDEGSRQWLQLLQSNRSEEHTSELQSQSNLVCRLLLEKK